MELRSCRDSDLPVLLDLCKLFTLSPFSFDEQFVDLAKDKTLHPSFAKDMIESDNAKTIVLDESGTVCGFITVSLNHSLSKNILLKVGTVLLLVVDQKYRGNNYGKLLVQKGLALLFTLGAELITVGTDIYNIPAIRIYEALGFRFMMGWHIFRYYHNPFEISPENVLDNIEPVEPVLLDQFYPLLRRPISLSYDKAVNQGFYKTFLINSFQNSILKGKSSALSFNLNGIPVGLVHYMKDEIARKTLRIDEPVYKIVDLMAFDLELKQDILVKMLLDLKARIHHYSLMEIWAEAGNSELIQAAEKAGFVLSYSGLTFHQMKKNTTDSF